MQARGRLIEDVHGGFNEGSDRAGFRARFTRFAGFALLDHGARHAGLGEFSDQFDSLCLPSRKGRAGLAEGEVTEADILQEFELILN